eukprot:CAMPEP_0183365444 /NCGR_PEP_ID=MMETSP0164_2-20130417/84809_1 /TAXON_ID=221442 /ORGANISM="Coccolithus pelagicus ssp braarudi, Strain PLY182g" /LENGTH=41 /DNA_ID= /DNA_START= /DNA_END= /DNA_ORIENTATION=
MSFGVFTHLHREMRQLGSSVAGTILGFVNLYLALELVHDGG